MANFVAVCIPKSDFEDFQFNAGVIKNNGLHFLDELPVQKKEKISIIPVDASSREVAQKIITYTLPSLYILHLREEGN